MGDVNQKHGIQRDMYMKAAQLHCNTLHNTQLYRDSVTKHKVYLATFVVFS